MNRVFAICSMLLIFCPGPLSSQASLSGVINSYAKVISIGSSSDCAPSITVDDASPFAAGDYIMIIQMKGAEIDVSNSSSFGTILNLNSAGLFERAQISSISGNDISLNALLAHNYDVNSSVQIVNILQYANATIAGTVFPAAWDGDKGGILAIEVSGILTMNANINASSRGFRGGVRDVSVSSCSWVTEMDDYAYPDGSWRGESKGEGIAEFMLGMENGRGPQGTGGGGGNDHNSGGGGGSNFSAGGNGGENTPLSAFDCDGGHPGLGGYANPSVGNRLFMGGGGGAGHDNNDTGSDGGAGGGIVYIKANQIDGNWNSISVSGESLSPTPAFDGGGGGGAGGSILLDAPSLFLGLTLYARGGKGSDFNALNSPLCMGPGGGGSAGVIFTDLVSPTLYPYTEGGVQGVIINSTSPCNGSNNNAGSGTDGSVRPYPTIATGTPITYTINFVRD